jgi:outer membrane protein OmpA-like peptidoglycan-associated protein
MGNQAAVILFLILLPAGAFTQYEYTIEPVPSVNTPHDDIMCGLMNGNPIYTSNDYQDLVNDFSWNEHFIFRLKTIERGKTFLELSNPKRMLPFPGVKSEGTGSFNSRDSVFYFSTSENYGLAKGNRLKIYSTRWNGIGWSRPVMIPFCSEMADYAHPHFNPEMNVLVFSSNRSGGMGGMDIWYSFLNGSEWTSPVNLGLLVNTPRHELFPTVFRGDIYFSSDGIVPSRGFELFRCEKRDQWKAALQLPEPLNSSGDDVMIYFLSEFRGYVSSRREGGKGGDDIYLFDREETNLPPNRCKAELELNGVLHAGAGVLVTNELGEIMLDDITDASGAVSLAPLKFGRRLRLAVTGITPSSYKDCILYIVDENGNRVRTLRLNEFGWVELELLPFDYTELALFPNSDASWLSVSLEGILIAGHNDEILQGEPITILDEKNNPVAVAYTRPGGAFSFDHLAPGLSYTFHLSEKSKASEVIVMDQGREITLPVLREEAIYRRLNAEDAIAIVSEKNETVFVSPSDLFVVNRIYYEYTKFDLSEIAEEQLAQLAWLLERNQGIAIEVNSHTDSRGTSSDNLKLSQLRAESAIRFLESKGVQRSRMTANGRGEEQLLNHCSDDVQCTEEEHAINRRTEIRFVKDEEP